LNELATAKLTSEVATKSDDKECRVVGWTASNCLKRSKWRLRRVEIVRMVNDRE
jgi:hypothetical protein